MKTRILLTVSLLLNVALAERYILIGPDGRIASLSREEAEIRAAVGRVLTLR